jgi:hypothetical protein
MSELQSNCSWQAIARRQIWQKCVRTFLGVVLPVVGSLNAADPHIDLIEPFVGNQVSIHYWTIPNRITTLQYRDFVGTNGVISSSTGWSNLYTAERLPFPEHIVWIDTGTNRHRFYRLRVTP